MIASSVTNDLMQPQIFVETGVHATHFAILSNILVMSALALQISAIPFR